MPRNSTTGVFTRVANSFSNPVFGTLIDPTDADSLFDDYDLGLTNSIPKEPVVVTTSSDVVAAGTPAVAIQRAAPATTAITLPPVADQDGTPLRIVDWSTAVTDHAITITPDGSETIMLAASWPIYSTASSLASVTLYPSTVLNGWYIAP